MIRASTIAMALLFSRPANVILPDPGDVIVPPQAIVQVVCFGHNKAGDFTDMGTAFRVGSYMLSVNHVTSSGQCFIAGRPIRIAYKSPHSDFSMLDSDEGPFLKIDCGGFVKGHRYVALGYGRGVPTITQVDLIATGETDEGEAILVGMFAVVPGQSGGPVVDRDTGAVVGTVNMENYEEGLSWSVPLSSTPLCRKP